jgi:pimeloyl-ACP methyl ester carboxylesterase
MDRVVLVHGLWMHGVAMFPLGRRVARCGFAVERFSYRSVRDSVDDNARRLADFLGGLDAPALHLVGHSMGGVVALRALALREEPRVRRVVLMGTPVAGSAAGRGLARFGAGRRMLGRSRPLWAEGQPLHAPPGVAVGVIAGSVPLGLGHLFARLAGPNDGVATVEETRLRGAADSIVLRANHTGMLFSPAVASQVCAFLRHGRFAHG